MYKLLFDSFKPYSKIILRKAKISFWTIQFSNKHTITVLANRLYYSNKKSRNFSLLSLTMSLSFKI